MFTFKNKAVLAAIIIAIGYCFLEARGTGDLLIFLAAGGDLSSHTDIYAKSYFDSYHYYYSVLFAILLNPLYHLSYYWIKLIWLLISMAMFLHLFFLSGRSRLLDALTPGEKNLFLILAFVFSLRFLHENIHASQITIVIAWCCIYGLILIRNKNTLPGSLLLAVGINLKLLPIVLLPYLLYRGYFRSFFLVVGFCAAAYLLPSFIIGHQYNTELLRSWFALINPLNKQHIMDTDERSFHSITTLLTTLFIEKPYDPLAMELKRNIADVSLKTLSFIILLARLILIGFTLYFLRAVSFLRKPATIHAVVEVAYILLIIPLIFPHQQHYAFFFIVPAFSLALLYAILEKSDRKATVFKIILVVVYLCCNLKILLGEFNRYYEHYKILTYGALLLIPLLVVVRNNLSEVFDKRDVPVL